MPPYRDDFRSFPERREGPEAARWRELFDRFGELAPADAWPAPPALAGRDLAHLVVSGGGTRIAIAADDRAWLLDAVAMHVVAHAALPAPVDQLAVDSAGGVIVLRLGDRLVAWRGDRPPAVLVRAPALAECRWLAVTGDGTHVLAATAGMRAAIRIYELGSGALVHAVSADASHGVAVHPSGRYLACIADGFARILGADGPCAIVPDVGAVAFAPSGDRLFTNLLGARLQVAARRFDVATGRVGAPELAPCEGPVDEHAALHPAPDGAAVLVGLGSRTAWVRFGGGAATTLAAALRGGGILVGGRRAIVGPSASHSLPVPARGAMVFPASGPVPLGTIVRAADAERLIAVTPMAWFGGLERAPAPLGDHPAAPYERPAAVRAALGDGPPPAVSADDQLRIDELAARTAAWRIARDELVVDVEPRQLVELNRGLSYLTPELVRRARLRAERHPRFGPPQLDLASLVAAGRELAALTAAERAAELERWIERTAPPSPPSAEPAPLVPAPPPPRWMRAIDEELDD